MNELDREYRERIELEREDRAAARMLGLVLLYTLACGLGTVCILVILNWR